jgi:hypothetical protein
MDGLLQTLMIIDDYQKDFRGSSMEMFLAPAMRRPDVFISNEAWLWPDVFISNEAWLWPDVFISDEPWLWADVFKDRVGLVCLLCLLKFLI